MGVLGAGLLLLASFVSAYLLTGRMRSYGAARLLDVPNDRSSHAEPTPRGGGLAIAASFSGALLVCLLAQWLPWETVVGLGGGGLVVAGIGFWDDHGHVRARLRMVTHLLAAAWAVYWLAGGGKLVVNGQYLVSGWAFWLAASLFIAWMLNLFNFMDGIDGIAGAETSFISLAAAALTLYLSGSALHALVPALLGFATLGFLIWNWPPARIFMGDVGSGFVGFVLGSLALYSAVAGSLSLTVWLILSAVFMVDATLTLLRRMLSGQRWYQAHCSHAFQRAASRFGCHGPVTLGVLVINALWLLPLATAAAKMPDRELWIALLAYAPLVALAIRLGAGKPVKE